MPLKNESDSLELQPGEERLQGVLERIVFFNEENQYCVGELRPGNRKETVTVSGALPGVQCGETIELAGQWRQHPQYGQQFKLRAFRSTLPASVYGIRKYLGSGLVPGIGKRFAERIVDTFGEDTLRVIAEESARLHEVEGIGKKRAADIKKAWDEQRSIRDVMLFLQTYGVPTHIGLKLVRQFGNQAQWVLKNDPYLAAREIDGIGFKTADRIAMNIGHGNDSAPRLQAGLLHSLKELENDGHTGAAREPLLGKAADLLQAPAAKLEENLDALLEQKAVHTTGAEDFIQLTPTYRAEVAIAESLERLAGQRSALPRIQIERAVVWAQDKAGFTFSPEQAEAIRASLRAKISILTGGPGTGKTTILRSIVDILKAKKVKVLLAAPTGRAAQRMSAAARHNATTLHRLLQFEPAVGRFAMNEDKPLSGDFLIVDEASMLDTRLAAAVVRALPGAAHLMLVGDSDQLPSVGAGNVLHDLIHCQRFEVTELRRIHRQGSRSTIVETAHKILHGDASTEPWKDRNALNPDAQLELFHALDPERCVELTVRLCKALQAQGAEDVQVIAPLHRGMAGIQNLNRELQTELNGQSNGVRSGETLFRLGDRIIQSRNNHDKGVYNGDIGTVTHINAEAGTLAAQFDNRSVEFERLELSDLSLAYAISVHKSQGSEFHTVILPLLKQYYLLLQRNLLYTALTRGKRKVIIVGDPQAYRLAVLNREAALRHTDLKRKVQMLLAPRV